MNEENHNINFKHSNNYNTKNSNQISYYISIYCYNYCNNIPIFRTFTYFVRLTSFRWLAIVLPY